MYITKHFHYLQLAMVVKAYIYIEDKFIRDFIVAIFKFAGSPPEISQTQLLATKEILVGSPPHSSNTTNEFPLGCFNHEQGTWYLKTTALSWSFWFTKQRHRNQEDGLTISERAGHNLFGICFQYKHNNKHHNSLVLYMPGNGFRSSDHIWPFPMLPISLKLMVHFLVVLLK